MSRVAAVSERYGLRLNATKTVIMSSAEAPIAINLGNSTLDQVPSFKYLGSEIAPDGSAKNEISRRINLASSAFGRLSRVLWNKRPISIRTKVRIYLAMVRTILLYCGETWAVTKADCQRLDTFEARCLRKIWFRALDNPPTWDPDNPNWTSNAEIRSCLDVSTTPSSVLRERRLRWFGHVCRRPSFYPAFLATLATPLDNWKRRPGGQKKTWLDFVKDDVTPILQGPISATKWKMEWLATAASVAQDRIQWRGIVRDASAGLIN